MAVPPRNCAAPHGLNRGACARHVTGRRNPCEDACQEAPQTQAPRLVRRQAPPLVPPLRGSCALTAPQFRYRAFISYSHQDRAWADWLHRALETYRVPRRLVGRSTAAGIVPRRLAPVFRDREELASAIDLGERV